MQKNPYRKQEPAGRDGQARGIPRSRRLRPGFLSHSETIGMQIIDIIIAQDTNYTT